MGAGSWVGRWLPARRLDRARWPCPEHVGPDTSGSPSRRAGAGAVPPLGHESFPALLFDGYFSNSLQWLGRMSAPESAVSAYRALLPGSGRSVPR